MRNSTMRDKLTSILEDKFPPIQDASDSNSAVAAVIRQMRRSKHPIAETTSDKSSLSSRYILPDRLKNPFSHREISAVPSLTTTLAEVEAQSPLCVDTTAIVSSAKSSENTVFEPSPDLSILPQPSDVAQLVSPDNQTVNTASLPETAASVVNESSKMNQPVAFQTAEKVNPEPSLPPQTISLEWLKQPTPFAADLNVMVEKLRSARQMVIFTLEQHRARAKEYRAKLDEAEYGVEVERENLRQLEDTIVACALVAEQSAAIKKGLLNLNGAHPKKMGKKHVHFVGEGEGTDSENKVPENGSSVLEDGGSLAAPSAPRKGRWTDDPNCLRRADVFKVMEENPGRNWTAAEVCAELPANKRARAKEVMAVLLSGLCNIGRLERITTGVYRLKDDAALGEEKSGTELSEEKKLVTV